MPASTGALRRRNVPNISADSALEFASRTAPIRITAGRSDPRPGVTPGAAEGAEEAGRSCPLSRLSATAGRTIEAANSRSNVVEPAALR
jgi:hypothetical protein